MAQALLRNRLKVLRAQHGLTQQALAQQVNVTRKTINVIEAGNYSPSVTLALHIAAALQVGVDDVFYLDQRTAL